MIHILGKFGESYSSPHLVYHSVSFIVRALVHFIEHFRISQHDFRQTGVGPLYWSFTVAVLLQDELHGHESATGFVIGVVEMDGSDCSITICVSRTSHVFIQARVAGRFHIAHGKERLTGRILPVEVFREISSVCPREHIDIV